MSTAPTDGPHVLSLLLNGVESPEDLSALAKRFPLRADIWQEMLNAKKPVAFNLMFTVGCAIVTLKFSQSGCLIREDFSSLSDFRVIV